VKMIAQAKISLEEVKQGSLERLYVVNSKKKDEEKSKQENHPSLSLVPINNKPDKKDWLTALNESNKLLVLSKYHLQFRIDKDSERIQVKLIDDETKEVIREIPPEQMLRLSALIKERIETYCKLLGIFVDEVA